MRNLLQADYRLCFPYNSIEDPTCTINLQESSFVKPFVDSMNDFTFVKPQEKGERKNTMIKILQSFSNRYVEVLNFIAENDIQDESDRKFFSNYLEIVHKTPIFVRNAKDIAALTVQQMSYIMDKLPFKHGYTDGMAKPPIVELLLGHREFRGRGGKPTKKKLAWNQVYHRLYIHWYELCGEKESTLDFVKCVVKDASPLKYCPNIDLSHLNEKLLTHFLELFNALHNYYAGKMTYRTFVSYVGRTILAWIHYQSAHFATLEKAAKYYGWGEKGDVQKFHSKYFSSDWKCNLLQYCLTKREFIGEFYKDFEEEYKHTFVTWSRSLPDIHRVDLEWTEDEFDPSEFDDFDLDVF